MAKIDLTPERAAIIREAAAEWLAVGRSTTPANFEAAEAAITRLYAAIGREPPRFARFHSPLGAELFLNLVNKTWPAAMGANLWDNLGANLRANLWDNLGANLRANLRANLWANLGTNLGTNLRANLWDNLGDNLWDNLWDNLGANLGANLRANLGANLGANQLVYNGTWFWGGWDSYLMWLDGGGRVGSPYPAKEAAMLADHMEVCRSIGWWYPHSNVCLLCDRPEILSLDAEGRLHNESGPAMSFRDGYSLWALNGLRLDRRIIEEPEKLTFDEVRDEPNTEVRRHMLARFAGLRGSAAAGAWLTAGNLKPISTVDITAKMQPSGLSIWRLSNGDAPVLCKLYRAEIPGDEPLVLLTVVCTSTAKETFLRVPPTMTNAEAARRWTFDGADLAQAVET